MVLSAFLGGEGMGLYQLILSLYMVFVSLATAGMNVAATRLAAQRSGPRAGDGGYAAGPLQYSTAVRHGRYGDAGGAGRTGGAVSAA